MPRLALATLLATVLLPLPAEAQRLDPNAYYRQFSDAQTRAIEYDLIWIGGTNAVTSGRIDRHELAAIRRFERSIGTRADGILRRGERRALRERAQAIRERVGYRTLVDPATGIRLGVPTALFDTPQRAPNGTRWRAPDGTAGLATVRLPGANLASVYRSRAARPGVQVTYKVLRDRWFVITGRENGRSFYTRARTDGSEVRLYTIRYESRMEGTIDPIIVAMSNDFEAFASDPRPETVALNPRPASRACGSRIRVERGETLSRIAARCGTSVNRLRRANDGLDPRDLQAGQTLAIPSAGEELPSLASLAPQPAPRVEAPAAAAPVRELPRASAENVEPVYAPTAVFAPLRPLEGRRITVSATGFPPLAAVEAGFTRRGRPFRARESARTDDQGRVTVRLALPDWLDAGQTGTAVIATPDGTLAAATSPFMVRSQPVNAPAEPDREPVVVSGMTTGENANCATMRDEEGRRVNLIGEVADYQPGTPVRVLGFETRRGGCGEGTTLEVTNIERRR